MNRKIKLESLSDGIDIIFEDIVPWYIRQCAICFHLVGHATGVILRVDHLGQPETFEIHYDCAVDDRMLRAFAGDKRSATNYAACAIIFALIRELTNYAIVEQAAIGTTVDYYLADKKADDDLIFNNTARVEISGILEENKDNTISDRIGEKKRRLKPEPTGPMPTFIAVVEFSAPRSQMVRV
jgi:hypothetical protein